MKIDYEIIESKDELLKLIQKLSSENINNWENVSTTDFLEALGAWLDDADGFYNNFELKINAEKPSWQLFGDALKAATSYE